MLSIISTKYVIYELKYQSKYARMERGGDSMAEDQARIKSEQRRQLMLEGKLLKVIVIVALPMVATMLIDAFYNMADAFFVSRISDAAVAAVGVNDSLMMLIRAVSMGFGMGSSSFISRALGAKKDKEAAQTAVTTLFTAMGVLLMLACLGLVFLPNLVSFLGVTEAVRPFSTQYARWILLSAPITAATTVLSQLLRSEGSTMYSMAGMASGCIINIALDPIFIYTLGLGVAGAAIATGISKFISMIILFSPFLRGKCVIRLNPSYFTPKKEIYLEIARMGIPTVLRTGMMSMSVILINNTAASFGDAAMASIAVANKSLRMIASGIMGFGQGFQPIAGYNYGAGNYGRVLQAFRYTITIGVAGGVALGTALGIFAPYVIRIFSGDADVMELGLVLIRTQSVTLIPHMLVMISNGFFQALGKAIKAGVIGLSRQLLSLIPCVLIMSYFFGVTGLVYAQATADLISFCLALILVIPTVREIYAMKKRSEASIVA